MKKVAFFETVCAVFLVVLGGWILLFSDLPASSLLAGICGPAGAFLFADGIRRWFGVEYRWSYGIKRG